MEWRLISKTIAIEKSTLRDMSLIFGYATSGYWEKGQKEEKRGLNLAIWSLNIFKKKGSSGSKQN